MKAGTQNHVKVRRLMRIAQIPLYRAVGILESIWLLCADCCDEGNIGKFTDEEIADYLGWDGPNPSELVRHLSDSGWLDPHPTYRYTVHDWLDHAPEYIRERIRKRRARESLSYGPTTYAASCSDSNGQVRTKPELPPLVPSIPNPTNPNQTQPTNLGCAEAGGRAGGKKFSRGWGKVADRLCEFGSSCWGQVIADAKAAGCNPGLALALIDYGKANGYGIGAINVRLSKARPSLANDAGWPDKPKVAAKTKHEPTEAERADRKRFDIVYDGRRAGKTRDQINADLIAAGLTP